MNHMNSNTDLVVMFFSMVFAGVLSTMNVWADRSADIRFGLNDVYMILLMTGWMFLFTGVFYKNFKTVTMGIILVAGMVTCIRAQIGITGGQYKLGMIPHHSMAVHMSKRYLARGEQDEELRNFAKSVIKTQEKEIQFLKRC